MKPPTTIKLRQELFLQSILNNLFCINRSAMGKQSPPKLPDLVWPKIFKFLEYDDLLNLVSLKNTFGDLKDLVSLYVQSKTVVINQGKKSYALSPFSSRYLISKSLVRFQKNDRMRFNVKKLVLFNPLMIFSLTGLDNLNHLIIESDMGFKCVRPVHFGLVNLKRFEVRFVSDKISIILEAPKLSYFQTYLELDCFKFIHLRSIQEVRCPRITPIVKQMANLVTLKIDNFHLGEPLFDRLKQLKHLDFFEYDDDFDETNNCLQAALEANPNLKVCYKGIDISSGSLEYDDLHDTSKDCLDDQNLWVYQELISAVDGHLNHSTLKVVEFENLGVDLVQKVTRLESLHILGPIIDDAKWVELLKLPRLAKLTINAALTEEQLNLIAKHCPSATCLEIGSFEAGDWVLQLKCLEEFHTDVLFDFELFKKMIRQLYYLKLVSLSESLKVRIEDAVVECVSGETVVLREPKSIFLQTIKLINLWGDLFCFKVLSPTSTKTDTLSEVHNLIEEDA